MRNLARFLMLFCVPIIAAALSLGDTHWKLEKSELESAGFRITGYSDQFTCESAYDVYVEVPRKFKGRKFYGGSLTIHNDDELLLYTNLSIEDSGVTAYSEGPFHGVSFCVGKSVIDSVTVNLYFGIFIKGKFGTGDHITEVVEVRNLEEWLD